MFKKFYPTKWVHSIFEIDFHKLYEKGYRGIISDIDNTLVEHDADASDEAIKLIKDLRKMGFQICLMSNNNEERVTRFNKITKVYMIFDAKKPSRKGYIKGMKLMNTTPKNTIFIGDQIFTDIYGANRTGIKSYLVDPISPKEEVQIVLKRYLEKIVLHFYKKQLQRKRESK